MALPVCSRNRLLQITAFFTFAFILTFLSCEKQNETLVPPDEPVVAKIGDRLITAEEFRNNYEVGFAHLKTGPDPKRAYLEYMINERLLALKGYQLGLDESRYVKNNEQHFINELMVEALLEKEVKSKIKITPVEIQNEINKSKVSFKFRYWVEPTLEKARLVVVDMRKRGYAEVLDEIIQNSPERRINPKLYETDYLTYLEVPEKVMNTIKDLPYGDISDPLQITDKYFIFQVLDIRRSAITKNEYKSRASAFEQIIFYRKYQHEVTNYTANLMQSKNIVTKKVAFNLLAHAVREWLEINPEGRQHFQEEAKHATDERAAIKALKNKLGSTFITYKDGHLSIENFLTFFNESRFLRQLKEKRDFREGLNQEVKNAIRDYFFVRRAQRLRLQSSPKLQRELNLWRDKWVFDEIRRYLASDLKLDEAEVKRYFSENRERYQINREEEPHYAALRSKAEKDAYRHQVNLILDKEVESLKKQYLVIINPAVLDTIKVTDSKKSRWMNIQVFRGGTNRPVLPGVDPFWEPSTE